MYCGASCLNSKNLRNDTVGRFDTTKNAIIVLCPFITHHQTTICQRFTADLIDGYTLEMNPLITLRPKHGMPMKVTKR